MPLNCRKSRTLTPVAVHTAHGPASPGAFGRISGVPSPPLGQQPSKRMSDDSDDYVDYVLLISKCRGTTHGSTNQQEMPLNPLIITDRLGPALRCCRQQVLFQGTGCRVTTALQDSTGQLHLHQLTSVWVVCRSMKQGLALSPTANSNLAPRIHAIHKYAATWSLHHATSCLILSIHDMLLLWLVWYVINSSQKYERLLWRSNESHPKSAWKYTI